MFKIKMMVLWIAALAAGVAQAEVWSTNLPCFYGGYYDGWDMQTNADTEYLGNDIVTMSSGADQQFLWTQMAPALDPLTITVVAYSNAPITNNGTLRVSVPAAWRARFETNAVVSYSGTAMGKVGVCSFATNCRTLSIPVTADFVTNDTLIVSGLQLLDLQLVPAGYGCLELAFTSNPRDLYDVYALEVSVPWSGGDYDGWDCLALDNALSLHGVRGTIMWVSMLGPNISFSKEK